MQPHQAGYGEHRDRKPGLRGRIGWPGRNTAIQARVCGDCWGRHNTCRPADRNREDNQTDGKGKDSRSGAAHNLRSLSI